MSSGVVSSFKFLNFKIDQVSFNMKQDIALVSTNIDASYNWDIQISIRKPIFFESPKLYVGGVNCELFLYGPFIGKLPRVPENALAKLQMGIVGTFQTENRFEKEVEEKLVKVQIPAILFPYLRSSISSFSASSGFNNIMVPLINIHKLVEDHQSTIEIQVVP